MNQHDAAVTEGAAEAYSWRTPLANTAPFQISS
jgi:hypothetical protein